MKNIKLLLFILIGTSALQTTPSRACTCTKKIPSTPQETHRRNNEYKRYIVAQIEKLGPGKTESPCYSKDVYFYENGDMSISMRCPRKTMLISSNNATLHKVYDEQEKYHYHEIQHPWHLAKEEAKNKNEQFREKLKKRILLSKVEKMIANGFTNIDKQELKIPDDASLPEYKKKLEQEISKMPSDDVHKERSHLFSLSAEPYTGFTYVSDIIPFLHMIPTGTEYIFKGIHITRVEYDAIVQELRAEEAAAAKK